MQYGGSYGARVFAILPKDSWCCWVVILFCLSAAARSTKSLASAARSVYILHHGGGTATVSTDDNHRALQISFIACTAETARPARSFGVAGALSPLQQGGGVQQHLCAIALNGVVAQPGHITGERIGTVGIDGDPLCLCGFEGSGDIARTS